MPEMRKKRTKAPPKRPYATPRLKVHGNLRDLTQVKGGNRSDGGRKPRTRASGGAT